MKKNQAKLPPGGVWRTIKGAKVYIKDGILLAGAGGKLSNRSEGSQLTDYVNKDAINFGIISKSNQVIIEKTLMSLESRFPGTLKRLDGIHDSTQDSAVMVKVKEMLEKQGYPLSVWRENNIASFIADYGQSPPKRYLLYNGEMFKDDVRKRIKHSAKKMREKGVHNIGNDVETATAHEFGHVLYERMYHKNKNLTPAIMTLRNNLYNKFVDEQLKSGGGTVYERRARPIDRKLAGKLLSEYATISGEEYFAECFAEYTCYDEIRDNAKEWGALFETAWSQLVKSMAVDLIKTIRKGDFRYAITTT